MAIGNNELLRVDNPCSNTQTYLHRSNWDSHVGKHPELIGQLPSVRSVVEDPDLALHNEQGVIFKYKHGLGTNKLAGLWLLVIEEQDAYGAHYVKSMYFTRGLKDDPVLCLRRIPREAT